MRFSVKFDRLTLAGHIPKFLALIGEERWFKRMNQLDEDQLNSPFLWKIVADYHWLEMALSYQGQVIKHQGSLDVGLMDATSRMALQFAGMAVEIHSRLGSRGRRTLEGRLLSAMKAETGFAALYLELDLACRLMNDGYEVDFPDLEGTGQYDLMFQRGDAICEVECKSLSADAGRKIHRKDFYRFMDSIRSALTEPTGHHDVLVVTLQDRLSPKIEDQRQLRKDVIDILQGSAPSKLVRAKYHLEREESAKRLPNLNFSDEQAVYKECINAFGPNLHVSGLAIPGNNCILVMRSKREDDTSRPLLEAMREASAQFSGKNPSFIAVQFQEIEPADLMLPHFRRRVGILSYALFGHYGEDHINSTYFCGYGAVVDRDGRIGTPAFSIANPQPRFLFRPEDAATFLAGLTDADYALALGESLPAPNISNLSF